MRKVDTGTATFILSTGVASASSGSWVNLGAAYTRFALRCVRGTSVGTSNFSVGIRAGLSTHRTTGAAVGAIAAYTPSTIIAGYTQASPGPGKLKLSTGLIPVQYVKYVVASMTTAANRKLRIELIAVP